MGIFTEVPNERIIEVICKFLPNPRVNGIFGMSEGVENTTFLVNSADKNYILTLVERRIDENEIDFIEEVMRQTALSGVSCAQLVRTVRDESFVKMGGRIWLMQTYLPGMVASEPTGAQCHAAGLLLASQHLACAEMSLQRPNPVGNSCWQELIKSCRKQKFDDWEPRLDKLEAEVASGSCMWEKGLPKGAVHGDFFRENVLFGLGGEVGVIDFGLACTEVYIYDLALALSSWSFDRNDRLNAGWLVAFLEGYTSKRTLLPEEQLSLLTMCSLACTRITLTRLQDTSRAILPGAVETKDPESFWKRYQAFGSLRQLLGKFTLN